MFITLHEYRKDRKLTINTYHIILMSSSVEGNSTNVVMTDDVSLFVKESISEILQMQRLTRD